jgi:5-hydroxyisourate hydrolase
LSRLTTHIPDTAQGHPAAGMLVQLRRPPSDAILLGGRSNANEHCSHGLLQEADLIAGEYFRMLGVGACDWPFPDGVVLRVALTALETNHQVPLQASAWSCSTYPGS